MNFNLCMYRIITIFVILFLLHSFCKRFWDCFRAQFLQSSGRVDTAIWMHHMDANKTDGEKAWGQLQKNAASNIEQVLETAPYKAVAVRAPTTHHENYQN